VDELTKRAIALLERIGAGDRVTLSDPYREARQFLQKYSVLIGLLMGSGSSFVDTAEGASAPHAEKSEGCCG
jgi:hypothetical protein